LLLATVYVAMNYDSIYRKFGERIEYLRKQKGITQEELAEKAGLHRAYFWDIENGRNISIKTAYKIAKALNIKLNQLFDF
jgi:transcriptional regulator with XRE-family HTH domain